MRLLSRTSSQSGNICLFEFSICLFVFNVLLSMKVRHLFVFNVLLSTKVRHFFLTEWFWRNFLMESWGLVRTSQSCKCKSKKIPNNFWGPFPQWNWPTGRKAATCQPSFQWPLPLINMWYTYSWMVESDWIGPEVGNDNLGLFLPVMLRNVHFSKRLPNAMDPTLLRDISVMPNDLLKKLERGFFM